MNTNSSHRRIPMNKTEMIEAVASETGLAKTEVAKVLNAYTNTIVKTVAGGGEHALAATPRPESKSRSPQLWFPSSLLVKLSRTLLTPLRNQPAKQEPKLRNKSFCNTETRPLMPGFIF